MGVSNPAREARPVLERSRTARNDEINMRLEEGRMRWSKRG